MIRQLFHSLIAVVLVAASSASRAEMLAEPSRYDPRTRTVAYHPMQVYAIHGYYGYFTRIEFAHEETDLKVALGDEDAWQYVTVDNNLLIKPTAAQPETNMVVISAKRSYNFILSAEILPEAGKKSAAPNGKNQQFLVVFHYPREAAQRAATEQAAKQREYIERNRKEREELAKALEKYKLAKHLKDADNAVVNTDYFGCGAHETLPIAAYDNNQFTYLKFSAGTAIPSFFVRNSLGHESLVNYNVEKDWVVIHRTFDELTLRNGKYTACLVNAERKTQRTKTGTISPNVTRRLIEERK